MAIVWSTDSQERSISEYFPLARVVCERALHGCMSVITIDTLCDRVVGFDINLDLGELLEHASLQDTQDYFESKTVDGKTVSLGCYDFLIEVHKFYTKHTKLSLRKGESLFHNYVGVLHGYQRDRTWCIYLALALEIAKMKNFHNVIAVSSSNIEDQKGCEQLGFTKIGDLPYVTSKHVPIQKDSSSQSVVYLYDFKKHAKL